IMRARRPDLLAVDDPVVAVALGAGAQSRDVGTTRRFREQLAPDLLTRCHRRQIFLLRLIGAERHQGRTTHALPDQERRAKLAVDALFLRPDHAFNWRRATAAILLRPR